MSEKPVSIIIDSYRHKCKTLRKNASDVVEEIQIFSADTYDLSWIKESSFWKRLHIDVVRLENGATIQTNNLFIYNCLMAKIVKSSNYFSKEFTVVPPELSNDDFGQRLQALLGFLRKCPSMPVKKIPVHISKGSHAIWENFTAALDANLKSLHLEFEETNNLEKADFILVQQDEFAQYQEKNFSICFVIDNSGNPDSENDIYPDENGVSGFIWNISLKNFILLIQFFDFFYWKSRFIEIAEYCIKESAFDSLQEAQELISLWRSCDKEFLAEEKSNENLFLLLDNSIVNDVKLTQKASFDVHRFYRNAWINDENINLTIDVPVNFNVGKQYDMESNIRLLYRQTYKADVRDVFVLTPDNRLVSTIFSDSKNTTVQLKIRVVADGGVDNFGIRCDGKTLQDRVYAYTLDTDLKLKVWINNRRAYDEKTHPVLCTLNGKKCSPSGAPERNSFEVIYTYDIRLSEVKDCVFSVQLEGVTGVAKCTFRVLPEPDTVLGRIKPFQKWHFRELISVKHGAAVVKYCKAPVKKIVCFPGVPFELGQAVFNKKYYPESNGNVTTEDRIYNGEAPCFDKRFVWRFVDAGSEKICKLENNTIRTLNPGRAVLRLESIYNSKLYQDIEFEVVSDKSKIMSKLLLIGMIISFISAFWYGTNFWALVFKAIGPAFVYYAGTHSEECLRSNKNKALFALALIVTFGVLLRGLLQEM